jgi:hypothetical protein
MPTLGSSPETHHNLQNRKDTISNLSTNERANTPKNTTIILFAIVYRMFCAM